MFILIQRSNIVGIFSTKEKMRMVIELIVQQEKEKDGTPLGNLSFRYIECELDDPFFRDPYNPEIIKAIFSLTTLHTEYFPNEVKTDWTTGEIINF